MTCTARAAHSSASRSSGSENTRTQQSLSSSKAHAERRTLQRQRRFSTDENKGTNNIVRKASKSSTSSAKDNEPPPSNESTRLSGVKHQVKHRATETVGFKLTERVMERVAEAAEHGAERAAVSKTLPSAARRLAKQGAARTAERAAGSAAPSSRGIFGNLPARTAAARLGRGVLIALPLAGAAFAAWIARSDYRRTREELDLARVRLGIEQELYENAVKMAREGGGAPTPATRTASPPVLDTSTVRCFGVATAADSANVVAHLVAAYGLYHGWAPDGIVNAEYASLGSAVLSTGGAVRGEYLIAARRGEAETLDNNVKEDYSGANGDGHDGGGERQSGK